MAGEHRIFVGVVDEKCLSAKTEFAVTKIGGLPDWPVNCDDYWPTCAYCNRRLTAVLQINCPLDSDTRDRTVFVFVCSNIDCQRELRKRGAGQHECGYWVAARVMQSHSSAAINEQPITDTVMRTDEWCDGAEDWDFDSETTGTKPQQNTDILASEFNAISLQNTDASQAASSAQPKSDPVFQSNRHIFAPHYLSAFDEQEAIQLQKVNSDKHVEKLLADYRATSGGSNADCDDEFEEADESGSKRKVRFTSEPYEKSTILSRDGAYRRFLKRISAYPAQILRYNVDSRCDHSTKKDNPILHTAERFVNYSAPRCTFCGAPCVFEFQILPTLIAILNGANVEMPALENQACAQSSIDSSEKRDPASPLCPEFGTAIVYTCERSCWSEAEPNAGEPPFRIEHVLVEPECNV